MRVEGVARLDRQHLGLGEEEWRADRAGEHAGPERVGERGRAVAEPAGDVHDGRVVVLGAIHDRRGSGHPVRAGDALHVVALGAHLGDRLVGHRGGAADHEHGLDAELVEFTGDVHVQSAAGRVHQDGRVQRTGEGAGRERVGEGVAPNDDGRGGSRGEQRAAPGDRETNVVPGAEVRVRLRRRGSPEEHEGRDDDGCDALHAPNVRAGENELCASM